MTQQEAMAYVQERWRAVEVHENWIGIERERWLDVESVRQKIGLRFTTVGGAASVVIALSICVEDEMPRPLLLAHNGDLSRIPLTAVDGRLLLRQVLRLAELTPAALDEAIDGVSREGLELSARLNLQTVERGRNKEYFRGYAE